MKRVIIDGVLLQLHEARVVTFLRQRGFRFRLVPPARTESVKTPDLVMIPDQQAWEIKTLNKARHRTIERALATALRQAPNVIFDLRDLKQEEVVVAQRKYSAGLTRLTPRPAAENHLAR